MQKVAQKRSLIDKLIEKTNIGGIATEKYFSPEFQQIMDQLRQVDDGIRAIVAGEQIGEASAPSDPISLKELLKSVKSNLNRREYIKAVADLSRFHQKTAEIVKLISFLKVNVDKIHEKFLFQDLDEESKKHLSSLMKRWSANLYFEKNLRKQANIADFLTNIGTERGRALSAWEKRYPNKVKKLKDDTVSLLSLSERLLSIILSSLKDLARARAKRNPDNYITIANKIPVAYKNYDQADNGFKKYYENNIKEFLEKQEFASPKDNIVAPLPASSPLPVLNKQKDDTTTLPIIPSPSPTTVVPVPPINEPQSLTKTIVTGPPSGMSPARIPPMPPARIPPMPPIPTLKPKPISTEPHTTIINDDNTDTYDVVKTQELLPPIKTSHKKFFNSLKFMKNESNLLLSSHIKRYAQSIWSTDPETSIKLFKISQSIKH